MAREVPMTIAEYKALTGQSLPPPAPRRAAPTPFRPQAPLLAAIQALAQQHAWGGFYAWTVAGEPPACWCFFWREALIIAHLLPTGGRLTAQQQEDVDALTQVGSVEVYTWHPDDLPAIRERLSRREGQHGHDA